MKKNLRRSLVVAAMASFIASPYLKASSHKEGISDEDLAHIRLRAGVGSTITQQELREQQQEQYRRDMHRVVAEAAQDRAAVAQHVFAFKHNFLIPSWLREQLPQEVSSQLLSFDMRGIKLTHEGTLEGKQALTSALLRVNGLEEDLEAATEQPASHFVRLINETGFQKDDSPLKLAKNFGALAMRLDRHEALGLEAEAAQNMMGALYHAASQEIKLFVDAISAVERESVYAPDVFMDLFASAGQLSRWAAHRTTDPQKKMTYVVDALKSFERARDSKGASGVSEHFFAKVQEEVTLSYDLFEVLMLEAGLPAGPVKTFINGRRAAF